MHPEITAKLSAIRHAELLAEADHARQVAGARGHRAKAPTRSGRRLGWRLVPAR